MAAPMIRRILPILNCWAIWLTMAALAMAAPRKQADTPPEEPTGAAGYAILTICLAFALLAVGRPHSRAKSHDEVREEAPLWKRLLGKKKEEK
jgi:hypothetical protein